jgi:hypothetical protein
MMPGWPSFWFFFNHANAPAVLAIKISATEKTIHL